MNEMERMRDLVARLNAAAKVYYQGEDEIMTNFEYDALYDELVDFVSFCMNISVNVKNISRNF